MEVCRNPGELLTQHFCGGFIGQIDRKGQQRGSGLVLCCHEFQAIHKSQSGMVRAERGVPSEMIRPTRRPSPPMRTAIT